jgi:ABC-type uncharacterized transport system permease subunit
VTDVVSAEALAEAGSPPGAPPGRMRSARRAKLRSAFGSVALYVAALATALAISALMVALTHGSPSKVFTAMYDGSVKGWGSFGYTLDNATPLIIVAVGTIVSSRAGLFNIGQEGQVTMGAMAGAFVALKVHPAGPLVLILALAAAAVGGALWAGIAALLRFWRGVEVVISSLLLTFVAFEVLSYALSRTFLLHEHGAGGASLTESDQLSSKVQLPHYGQYPHFNFGTGLVIGLALAAVAGVVLTRTTVGFRLRMLGLNAVASKRVGISAARLGTIAVMVSGACAGLAGGVMLTGQAYRITPTISNNVGWNGLLVALVARNNAWVAVGVALAFGALQAGGGFLATTGVPTDLVNVVEALIVLAAVFPPALQEVLRRRARSPVAVMAAAAGGAA